MRPSSSVVSLSRYTSLSRCRHLGAVFFSTQSPTRLCLDIIVSVQCCHLGAVSSSTRSPTRVRLGVVVSMRYLPLRDLLHVFVLVTSSTAIPYTSFLWSSCGVFLWCFCLGVFRYGDLLHIFAWVYSTIAISYISSLRCLPLRRSSTRLLQLPYKRQSSFLNWLIVQW